MSISPVALITGAGSGIGRATAQALARAGFRLVLVGRRADALEQTRGALPQDSEVECISADVADPSQASALVTAAVDRFERLDVLVNNAAVAPLLPIERHTPELLQQVYMTNAVGPACIIAAAWGVFQRQHASGQPWPLGACIVNVSTMGTRDPFPGFFGYAASKSALNLMVRSCASEGSAIGVRAFAVAPGAVETAMLRSLFNKESLPGDQCLAPARVAEEIAACVLGERDEHNGRVIFMSATAGVFSG